MAQLLTRAANLPATPPAAHLPRQIYGQRCVDGGHAVVAGLQADGMWRAQPRGSSGRRSQGRRQARRLAGGDRQAGRQAAGQAGAAAMHWRNEVEQRDPQ